MFAHRARNAGILGAAQRRGPHVCKPPGRRETRKQRIVAWRTARSQSRAQQALWRRGRHTQKRRGAGATGRGARRCRRRIGRTVRVNNARTAGIFGRRGVAQTTRPHLCKPPSLSETHKQRYVEWCTARKQRRAQQRPVVLRATAANKTWDESERPGGWREIGRATCESGTQHEHLRTPRRGATTQAACLQAARPERGAKSMQCGMARGMIETSRTTTPHDAAGVGGEADVGQEQPAGQGRIAGGEPGQAFATWARNAGISDAAARRNNVGRIFASHRAGTRRASNAMRHGARSDRNVARRNAPQRRGRRARRRRGASATNRATMCCRQRIGNNSGLGIVTQCGHLWTPRRGETKPEREGRATRCGMARGETTTSRKTTPRDATGEGRKEDVGQKRPAGQRGVATGNQDNCLRIGHATRAPSDAAAWHNSAGRIFASRRTGARRASNVRSCGMAHGEITKSLATMPRDAVADGRT